MLKAVSFSQAIYVSLVRNLEFNDQFFSLLKTRSYPEMFGDMSRVTLNFDLSKFPFVRF